MFRSLPPGEKETAQCGASFSFLGFMHYWGRSRKGKWIVRRKTASDRLSRALQTVSTWCKRHRHAPLRDQQAALRRKLLGHYSYYGITGNARSLRCFHQTVQRICHYSYYGITGNARSLRCFHQTVQRIWLKWLNRRGGRRLNWAGSARLLARYPLPSARVVHSVYHVANPAT